MDTLGTHARPAEEKARAPNAAEPGATSPSRIVVAIPCYNEELAVAGIVLRARQHADEVLVIDDGSTDQTGAAAALAGATVLRNPGNRGKGYSIQRAFRYARDEGFDALVLLDGDGQHAPEEIPLLLAPILAPTGAVDMSLGFRFGANTEMPLWRRVGKRALDYATAVGGAGVVTDSQCGYRAFGRRAIHELADRLRDDGFGIESEQLVHARDASLTFENVPITCRYEGLDTSSKGPVAHAMGVVASIIEMVTMRHPLLFLGVPSLLLLTGSAALLVLAVKMYGLYGSLSVPTVLGSATLAIIGTFGAMSALMFNLFSAFEARLRARTEPPPATPSGR